MQERVQDLQAGQSKLTRVMNTIQDNIGRLHEEEDNGSEKEETLVSKLGIPIGQLVWTSQLLVVQLGEYNKEVLQAIQKNCEAMAAQFSILLGLVTTRPKPDSSLPIMS